MDVLGSLARKSNKWHLDGFPAVQLGGYRRQLLALYRESLCDIVNMLPLPLECDAAEIRVLFPHWPKSTVCPGSKLPCCAAGDAPDPIVVALEFKLEQVAVGAAAIFFRSEIFCIIKIPSDLACDICSNPRGACHGAAVSKNGSGVSKPWQYNHVDNFAVWELSMVCCEAYSDVFSNISNHNSGRAIRRAEVCLRSG